MNESLGFSVWRSPPTIEMFFVFFYGQSVFVSSLTTLSFPPPLHPGLSLHHPGGALVPGRGPIPAASCGVDAKSAPPHQERPHPADSWHDGEPLPRDGTRHALHAGTHSLPACDRWGWKPKSFLLPVFMELLAKKI